ncbi:MAG: glutathione S-transferase family protein [Maricaulaceae bacterium]|jgi:glutathione S-transferase
MTDRPILYVGNKRYSSWSLRGWLGMKKSGLDFETVTIPLDTPEFAARIAPLSPTRTVPVLHAEGLAVWDSLAICELAAEAAPEAHLWPRDSNVRAVARSLCATMHSSFAALRDAAPMNLGRDGTPKAFSDAVRADIDLIEALWREHRTHDGPYFFGDWSIVDAFWTPVATRFRSYAVELSPDAQAYADALLADPAFAEWRADALVETFPNPLNDDV